LEALLCSHWERRTQKSDVCLNAEDVATIVASAFARGQCHSSSPAFPSEFAASMYDRVMMAIRSRSFDVCDLYLHNGGDSIGIVDPEIARRCLNLIWGGKWGTRSPRWNRISRGCESQGRQRSVFRMSSHTAPTPGYCSFVSHRRECPTPYGDNMRYLAGHCTVAAFVHKSRRSPSRVLSRPDCLYRTHDGQAVALTMSAPSSDPCTGRVIGNRCLPHHGCASTRRPMHSQSIFATLGIEDQCS